MYTLGSCDNTSAGDAARARDALKNLLPHQADRAYLVAREIAHPWYRCQALTHAAAHLSKPMAVRALLEALDAAATQSEPNRIVSVSSWPMSLLALLEPDLSRTHADRLLEVIASEVHSLRRADALILLLEAVFYLPESRSKVLRPLLAALHEGRGWRIERLTKFTALVMAEVGPQEALDLLSTFPDSRETRQARRMIAAREWLGPHEFTPYYSKPSSNPA